jgi:hypothetical protein
MIPIPINPRKIPNYILLPGLFPPPRPECNVFKKKRVKSKGSPAIPIPNFLELIVEMAYISFT